FQSPKTAGRGKGSSSPNSSPFPPVHARLHRPSQQTLPRGPVFHLWPAKCSRSSRADRLFSAACNSRCATAPLRQEQIGAELLPPLRPQRTATRLSPSSISPRRL